MTSSSYLIDVDSYTSNQKVDIQLPLKSFASNMFTDNNTSLYQTSSNSNQPSITYCFCFLCNI